MLGIVDAEVARLPEVYRLPVLLCVLQERSVEEAARILGWSTGSVRGRLARARQMLRERLAGRGIVPSGGALTLLAPAKLPHGLVSATLRNLTSAAPVAVNALAAGATLGFGINALCVVRRLPGPNSQVALLVFSADGRTLASGGEDQTVRLWEVATGKERSRLVGHRGWVLSGAFSPDGRRFFSGSNDTTVLIWDVTGRVAEGGAPMENLSPRELEKLRTDLAAADASKAYRALWALAAAPRQTILLFRNQLRPVVAADPNRVARLMADLDSDLFAVRQKATKELQEMGEGALPALRKALDSQPALELRRRVEQMLERLDELSAEQLYSLRAVEVLERISTSDARRVLEKLAEGIPEARLTREAQASLERLQRRTP